MSECELFESQDTDSRCSLCQEIRNIGLSFLFLLIFCYKQVAGSADEMCECMSVCMHMHEYMCVFMCACVICLSETKGI